MANTPIGRSLAAQSQACRSPPPTLQAYETGYPPRKPGHMPGRTEERCTAILGTIPTSCQQQLRKRISTRHVSPGGLQACAPPRGRVLDTILAEGGVCRLEASSDCAWRVYLFYLRSGLLITRIPPHSTGKATPLGTLYVRRALTIPFPYYLILIPQASVLLMSD